MPTNNVSLKDPECLICHGEYLNNNREDLVQNGLIVTNLHNNSQKNKEGSLVLPCGHVVCVYCIRKHEQKSATGKVTKCFQCPGDIDLSQMPARPLSAEYRDIHKYSDREGASILAAAAVALFYTAYVCGIAGLVATVYPRADRREILIGWCLSSWGQGLFPSVIRHIPALHALALQTILGPISTAVMSLVYSPKHFTSIAFGAAISAVSLPLHFLALMCGPKFLHDHTAPALRNFTPLTRIFAARHVNAMLHKKLFTHYQTNGRGTPFPVSAQPEEKAYQEGYERAGKITPGNRLRQISSNAMTIIDATMPIMSALALGYSLNNPRIGAVVGWAISRTAISVVRKEYIEQFYGTIKANRVMQANMRPRKVKITLPAFR